MTKLRLITLSLFRVQTGEFQVELTWAYHGSDVLDLLALFLYLFILQANGPMEAPATPEQPK